ncbi:MAG: hypothetical protein KC435_14585 [Thermomicrobiales bacterium]|nr:hypothetical protein [Thermomicrobiales bacterium]
MATEKQAKLWANRQRELFAVKMFAAGRDEELPDYDLLFDEAREKGTEISKEISALRDQIISVRKEHRITRWIGPDGIHLTEPRRWPNDPLFNAAY